MNYADIYALLIAHLSDYPAIVKILELELMRKPWPECMNQLELNRDIGQAWKEYTGYSWPNWDALFQDSEMALKSICPPLSVLVKHQYTLSLLSSSGTDEDLSTYIKEEKELVLKAYDEYIKYMSELEPVVDEDEQYVLETECNVFFLPTVLEQALYGEYEDDYDFFKDGGIAV